MVLKEIADMYAKDSNLFIFVDFDKGEHGVTKYSAERLRVNIDSRLLDDKKEYYTTIICASAQSTKFGLIIMLQEKDTPDE